MLWLNRTLASRTHDESDAPTTFSAGRHYVEICHDEIDMPAYEAGSGSGVYNGCIYTYALDFFTPNQKDETDIAANSTYGNDSPVYATGITSFPYSNNNLTLNKSDRDMFEFTTDSTGGILTVKVTETENEKLYIPKLYDADDITIIANNPPEWTIGESIAGYTLGTVGRKNANILEYANLEPNHTYYISVERPDSDTYDAFHTYGLSVSIAEPEIPSAVLSGNVALSHTIGDTITDLSTMYAEVMQILTCYINDVEIADSEALADVKLYCAGVELTVSGIGELDEGNYNLIAKYRDVEATGGTISLMVAASESEEPNDDEYVVTVEPVTATEPYMDWAAVVKMMVNSRLSRKGFTPISTTVPAIVMTHNSSSWNQRATLTKAIEVANTLYRTASNMTADDLDVFYIGDVNTSDIMTTIYNNMLEQKPIVALLTETEDMSLARYILITGIDRTNNEIRIIDPYVTDNVNQWISADVLLNGGYLNNVNLKFSGRIIEFDF